MSNTYGLDKSKIDALNDKFKGRFDIEFLTIHKSKGLQAKYVFIAYANGKKGLSFPSTREDDPLVKGLLSRSDTFLHAEERRLFYVALTRAKKKSIVLFKSSTPSSFILELMCISLDYL